MSTPFSPMTPERDIPPTRSKWRQIGITIASAVLLGIGSCFGVLSSGGTWVGYALLILFFLCVAVFVGGLIWAFATWAQKFGRGE
jgi:hypothetical protein